MKKVLCIALCAMMCSCGVYKKYQPQQEAPKDLFGQTTIGDTLDLTKDNMAELSWREFFVDPILQELIDSALVRNTDMRSAQLTLKKAEASLKAAKLAFLPSLSLQPSASVYSTMGTNGSLSGNLSDPQSTVCSIICATPVESLGGVRNAI